MIKLIATDMDGTFLDSNKMFDYDFIKLFYEMQKQNIIFVIASGNQFLRLYHQFIPMSDQIYFVADNGSYIGKGPNQYKTFLLSKESYTQIIPLLKQYPELFTIVSGVKGAHLLKKDEKYIPLAKQFYRNLIIEDSFESIQDDILKVSTYDPNGRIQKYEQDFKAILPDTISCVTAGNDWIDFQTNGVNKGSGIKYLQEKLNISPYECMAFGDAMNDVSLLKSVRYSYAMQNANPHIKELALRMTDSNDHNGVTKVIKEVVEGKFRY